VSSKDVNTNKVFQDSPKEDFILCPDCEHYLGIVEGQAADTYLNWREKVHTGEFQEYLVVKDLTLVHCMSADPNVLRLLVYSMFWRASISGHPLFERYRLAPGLEESLRGALLEMKSPTTLDFLLKLGEKALSTEPHVCLHPYACLTARSFMDGTANILAALKARDPASLNVDRFGFLLYERLGSIEDPFFVAGSNTFEGENKIMVLSEAAWDEIMVKRPTGMVVKEMMARRWKEQ
jgi:hypothetical protein